MSQRQKEKKENELWEWSPEDQQAQRMTAEADVVYLSDLDQLVNLIVLVELTCNKYDRRKQ